MMVIIKFKIFITALVHDLAESVVGDITPYCGISKEDKKLREQNAMEDIAKLLDDKGDYLLNLFNVSLIVSIIFIIHISI